MSTEPGFYLAIDSIGGGMGAIDKLKGAPLQDKEAILAFIGTEFRPYHLDADSGVAENDPLVISPDEDAGNKRWILSHGVFAGLTLYGNITMPNDGTVDIGTGQLTCGSINRASGTLFFNIGGAAKLSLSNTTATFSVPFYIKEQAAASQDFATYGQLWIDNSDPCRLRFTNDIGGDFYVVVSDAGTGGAESAGAGKQYVEMEIAGSVYKVLHDGTV